MKKPPRRPGSDKLQCTLGYNRSITMYCGIHWIATIAEHVFQRSQRSYGTTGNSIAEIDPSSLPAIADDDPNVLPPVGKKMNNYTVLFPLASTYIFFQRHPLILTRLLSKVWPTCDANCACLRFDGKYERDTAFSYRAIAAIKWKPVSDRNR